MADGRARSAPDALECRLDGEYVSGTVYVRDASRSEEPVDAAIGNVRATVRIDARGVEVQVTEPMRFGGRGEGVYVHAPGVIETPGVHVDAMLPLGARVAIGEGRVRVGVQAEPALDLAVRCEGLVAGYPARGPSSWNGGDVNARGRVAVDGEVALYAEASLEGGPIAWLGAEGRASVLVAALSSVRRGVVRVRVVSQGVVVTGFARSRALTVVAAESEVFPTPSGVHEREVPGTRTSVDLPAGAPVFALPTSASPWATTTVAMQLVATESMNGRLRVLELVADVAPDTAPSPSTSRSRRVVHAYHPVQLSDPRIGLEAAWVLSPAP